MHIFEFIIPLDPAPKQRPRKGKYGSFYTPKKTTDFENAYKRHIRMAMANNLVKRLDGPVKLWVEFHIKRGKTVKRQFPVVVPDIDNLQKLLLDSMNRVLFKDDAQVIELNSKKLYAKELGEIHVRVEGQ